MANKINLRLIKELSNKAKEALAERAKLDGVYGAQARFQIAVVTELQTVLALEINRGTDALSIGTAIANVFALTTHNLAATFPEHMKRTIIEHTLEVYEDIVTGKVQVTRDTMRVDEKDH